MKNKCTLFLTLLVTAFAFSSSTRPLAQTTPQNPIAPQKQTTDSKPESAKTKEFTFDGGSLNDFILKIKEHFGIDLWQHATIPGEMRNVQIPKIRMKNQNIDLDHLLILYNQLSSEGNPNLGHWIAKGVTDGIPHTLVLVASRETDSHGGSQIAIRAFSLKGIAAKDRDILLETIHREQEQLGHEIGTGVYGSINPIQARGSINYHGSSEILVAKGGKLYVDLVSSMVDVFRNRLGITRDSVR